MSGISNKYAEHHADNRRQPTSHYAYYNPQLAQMVKIQLADPMILDKQPRQFLAKSWGYSANTFERIISRAALYLADNDDTADKRYRRWRDSIVVSKPRDDKGKPVGTVLIRWKYPDLSGGILLNLEQLDSETQRKIEQAKPSDFSWQTDLDTFINEQDAPAEFKVEGLRLTSEDVKMVKMSIMGVSGIEVVEINSDRIVMRKI